MKTTLLIFVFALTLTWVGAVQGQTSSFTYQGSLNDGAAPANGTYQMQFALFDAATDGVQQGSTITNNSVSVVNGVFAVQLDFTPTPFGSGGNRWLEISVKRPADAGFTTLSPRQPITSSPFSVRTLSANATDSLSASCVQCVADSQISSLAGNKIIGPVASADSATTAGNVSGVVPITNGGTGSNTKNFVDLSTTQSIGGDKTFTGNVTVAGTLAAVLGQSANTVYGTANLTVTPASGFTLIPGMTQTINVPADYSVFISSSGGVQTTSLTATGFSSVDVVLAVDGNRLPNGGYTRVLAVNSTGIGSVIENWSFSAQATLTPGSHTFALLAAGTGNGTNATVGGNNTSVLQGALTVILIKK